ncbi:hypothetical protein NHQ30_003088 [Ciborinia camelliae]|nr:hypothetical protein NHQ30_003088 [Ciborinia camelliae]
MNESTDTVLNSLNAINANEFVTDGDRNKALIAAYALVSRLETPWETVARLGMNQPALGASLKVAKDLQLFEKWHKRGDSAEDSNALATMVNCDPALFGQSLTLLRNYGLQNIMSEPDKAPLLWPED